jgi:hypothetical protein
MNLYNLNSDKITMNIDGKDIEMKPAICFGKKYDKWLVSKCGKIWSISLNKPIKGYKSLENGLVRFIQYSMCLHEDNWWGDGSSSLHANGRYFSRKIKAHMMVIDTWAPLYDNPPEGISWEEWEIVRDLPTVYNHISKTGSIDHIDDNPANNHLDNLRRVNDWDNQVTRKAKGI